MGSEMCIRDRALSGGGGDGGTGGPGGDGGGGEGPGCLQTTSRSALVHDNPDVWLSRLIACLQQRSQGFLPALVLHAFSSSLTHTLGGAGTGAGGTGAGPGAGG